MPACREIWLFISLLDTIFGWIKRDVQVFAILPIQIKTWNYLGF